MSPYPIHPEIIPMAGSLRFVVNGPQSADEAEAWRKVYHDYLAAMRTLRYLAQKGLQNPSDTPDQAAQKKDSLDRHLKHLDEFEKAVVEPLLQDLPRSPSDVSP